MLHTHTYVYASVVYIIYYGDVILFFLTFI